MAKKIVVPAASESQALDLQAPLQADQGVQRKPLKTLSLKKREEEEQQAASDKAAEELGQLAEATSAPMPEGVLIAQAATAPAATAPAAAASTAPAAVAAASVSNLAWVGLGAVGLAAMAGGGGDDAPPAPTYKLTANAAAVNEGNTAVFVLETKHVAAGKTFAYQLAGVDAADVVGGMLDGTAVIGADGKAEIRVQLVADRATEGAETLTVSVAGQAEAASMTVNDTSFWTAVLAKSAEAVDEGGVAVFTLTTTNVDAGATFDYTIAGVSAADVVGGALTGTATIGADGKAEIRVQLVADRATEGAESLSLTVAGQSQSVTVNDTSVNPTYTLAKSAEAVDEGGVAVFTLTTTNVDAGATFDYTIAGVSAADVVGGALTGTATIGADGKAEIRVQLVADRATEGAESLSLTVAGQSQSVTVNDTSFDAPFNLTPAQDDFAGQNKGSSDDNLYIGRVSEDDSNTTFTEGDRIDGGAGVNTLRLFMDTRTFADGVDVSNIQKLDLRLTQSEGDGYTSTLVMTDWDESLQNIDIRSNKSNLVISEQQVVADVSISDQSTAAKASSYAFGYAAGVLDSDDDHLNLRVDNVNGTGYSDVVVDGGMESIAIDVADRQGDQYASQINLKAAGVADITVTGGRAEQAFVLDTDVAAGAAFDSTGFKGDMELYSGDITHAEFGAGNDNVTVYGQASDADARFDLGEGDNTININADLGGAVIAGNGVNTVNVNANSPTGNVLATGSITLGDGGNTITADGDVLGHITAGAGDDSLTVGNEVTGDADVKMGEGANTVTIADDLRGDAKVAFGSGDDVLSVGNDFRDAASVTFAGGDNTVNVADDVRENATIVFGAGHDEMTVGGEIGESSNVSDSTVTINFGDGDDKLTVAGSIKDTNATASVKIDFGAGDNELAVTGEVVQGSGENAETSLVFGDGANTVTVGGKFEGASMALGDGDNTVTLLAEGNNGFKSADVSFGSGDNTVSVAGQVRDSSLSFTGGDNTVTVGNLVKDSTITFGDGVNTLNARTEIVASHVTLGHGGNTVNVGNGINDGTQLSFGAGADTLTVGKADAVTDDIERSDEDPILAGEAVATVVDMGAGEDHVVLLSDHDDKWDDQPWAAKDIVNSGAFVRGGEGADTLTLRAQDDINLIARNQLQVVAIDFSGQTFVLDQTVSVAFSRGEESFEVSHTVNADDFVQGPDNLLTSVVASLVAKLNTDDAFKANFTLVSNAGKVTVTSLTPHDDFDFSSVIGDEELAEVVQISDTGISGFETMVLVAQSSGNDALVADDRGSDADVAITADFDRIDGTDTVHLVSELERRETITGEDRDDTYQSGGVATFNLLNFKGGEALHVSGHEASATGNTQVERIMVGNTAGAHAIGDRLTVTVDGVELAAYVVTAADLAADEAAEDATTIAHNLAKHIEEQLDVVYGEDESGVSLSPWAVEQAGTAIWLVGPNGEGGSVELAHTREAVQTLFDYKGLGEDGPVYDLRPFVSQLEAGDVVTIEVGEDTYEYTIKAEDLDPACTRTHAEIISEAIAALVPETTAQWGAVHFDGGFTVTVERTVQTVVGETVVDTVRQASATDDSTVDVVLNAQLADAATDTTMDLTVAGAGAFDLAITGGEDSGYTALDLKLGDGHDHTLNLGGIGFSFLPAVFRFEQMDESVLKTTKAFDLLMNNGDVVRVYADYSQGLEDFNSASVSTDGGVTFTALEGVANWTSFNIVMEESYPTAFLAYFGQSYLFAIQTMTVYAGDPLLAATTSIVLDSAVQAFGNFRDAVTVSDVEGVITTGSTITLDNVLAHTVTSTSSANLNIDQYSVRETDLMLGVLGGDFAGPLSLNDETLTVTTGSGDDHLVTLAQSAMAEGSSIDLGAGSNTLSLGWGEDAVLNSAALEAVGGIQYSGDLTQLNILNAVRLDQDSTTLHVPGEGETGHLTLADLEVRSVPTQQKISLQVAGFAYNANMTFELYTADGTTYRVAFSDGSAPQDEITLYKRQAGETEFTLVTLDTSDTDAFYASVAAEFQADSVSFDDPKDLFTVSASSRDFNPFVAARQTVSGETTLQPAVMLAVTSDPVDIVEYASDLTVVGASADLVLESAGGFELGGTGEDDGVGTLTVQRRDGAEITGHLSVAAGSQALFNLGNHDLAALTVEAGADAEIFIAGNSDAEFSVDEVAISSANGVVDFVTVGNTETKVTLGEVVLSGDEDADLVFEYNTGLTAVVGDVTITSADDADVQIDGNSDSSIELGRVSITGEGDSTNELVFENNTGTTASVTSLDIVSSYEAQLYVYYNTESNFSVAGDIRLTAGDYDAYVDVATNYRTDVDLSVDGTLELTSCKRDATLEIYENRNNYDPYENGPDQGALLSRNFAITTGDVAMDAGRNAELWIVNNQDGTYYGDLAVSVGAVDMVAYDYAELKIKGNDSTKVSLGDVSIRSRDDASVLLDDNDGKIYEDVGSVTNRDEADYAEITLASVTVASDTQAYMGIGDHDTAARVTVTGAIELTGVDAAGLEIISNDGTPDSGDNIDASLMDIKTGDVTVTAEGLAGVSIGLNYSGKLESTGGEFAGGNTNAAIELGLVTIEATDASDADASMVIANNLGEDGRGSVDLEGVTMTSAKSGNFFVYGNVLSGGEDEEFVGLTVGDVSMTSALNANLAFEDNDMVMSFGTVSLTAAAGEGAISGNAQLDFKDNDGADATFKDVTLSGVNTGLFVNSNSDSSVEMGAVELVSEGTGKYVADVTVKGNVNTSVKMASVDITSDVDALLEVTGNSSDASVDIGDVSIDAGEAAAFTVMASDSDVVIGATLEEDDSITRGSITIEAQSVGEMPSIDPETFNPSTWISLAPKAGFLAVSGEDGSIVLGDINITAAGEGEDSDATGGIGAFGKNTRTDVGDITVKADGDAAFMVGTDPATNGAVKTGDITITSGLAALGEDSSELYFGAYELRGNADVEKDQSITLTALSGETGVGSVYVEIDDAKDLVNLTVSGTRARIELLGDVGPTDDGEPGTFTLDLSGMTGQGKSKETWVYTWDATFDDDLRDVVVKVGSGDLVYNAAYGAGDWFDEQGWYSLGDDLDLTTKNEVTTITFGSAADPVVGEDGTATFSLTYAGQSYTIKLEYDGEDADPWTVDRADGAGLDAFDLLAALGEGAKINVKEAGGGDSLQVKITGADSGEAVSITGVTNLASANITGNVMGHTVTVAGESAVDGLGNVASEIFTFVGDDIGTVVIGGFRPNGIGLFAQTEVDRLDFSNFLDIAAASDLRITIEQGGSVGDENGYFDDVLIDFVNQDYGSIRLVGVGEYFTDANVNGISNSIIFA